MLKKLTQFCLAVLVTCLYWLYSRFWFIKHIDRSNLKGDTPRLYAHWHGDELLLVGSAIGRRMVIMVSRSKDGELMRRLAQWLGFHVVRGSSTRGGAGGLKGMIDAVIKEKYDASVAVDGPRGPIYKVKPGVLKLAQQTGCPIIPAASAASRRHIFKKAWNRCYLPLPFSKCVVVYGEPIEVPSGITDAQFEALRLTVEGAMLSLKIEAEAYFKRKFRPIANLQTVGV